MKSSDIAAQTKKFLEEGGKVDKLEIITGKDSGTRSRAECRTNLNRIAAIAVEKRKARKARS